MPEPTADEQLALEYINLLRADPAGEYARLTDPAVYGAIADAVSFFGVSLSALRQQLGALSPAAPLAWNSSLAAAAQTHNALMIAADTQSHQLPGEAGLSARLAAAGYNVRIAAENLYAFSEGTFYGHAGFVIDWGHDDEDFDAAGQLVAGWDVRGDGIQDQAGHRAALTNRSVTEIGIAITPENDRRTSVGPFVTTHELGLSRDYRAQVLGVVIDDRDGDDFYDVGEGLSGVSITLTGAAGTFATTSWASGGWQIAVPAGTYSVRFAGGALTGAIDSAVTIGSQNVKLDAEAAPAPAPAVPGYRHAGLNDFDGDRHSDLLWQNANGALSSWRVTGSPTGSQLQQNSFFAAVDASWNVVETFDRNGDGRADILWRRSDGTVSVWDAVAPANGAGTGFRQGSYTAGSPGSAWQIAAIGDWDGDARDDILWRHDDGSVSIWRSADGGFQQNAYFHGPVGSNWRVAGMADFDGDGRDDILWREDGGAFSEWLSTGSGFAENGDFDASVSAASGWKIAALADFNRDGRDDMLWRNDNGALSVWQSAGGGAFAKNTFSAQVSQSWSIAQAGDFNGDGAADLLWRNGNGAISIWQANGGGFDQNVLYDPGPAAGWTIQAHEFLV